MFYPDWRWRFEYRVRMMFRNLVQARNGLVWVHVRYRVDGEAFEEKAFDLSHGGRFNLFSLDMRFACHLHRQAFAEI